MSAMTERVADDLPACSIERSLQVLGERWTFLVLREVFAGRHRFAEMRASLDIAPNLLSARLKTLVAAGVLEARPYQEPGSRQRHSYHLTPAGWDLRVVLGALQQWGDVYLPRTVGPSALRRTKSGEPVHVAFVNEAGVEVPTRDVEFVITEAAR
jgi:DNA-binding HxlR family transcriptional regulator